MKRFAASGVLVLLLGTSLCLWLFLFEGRRASMDPSARPWPRVSQGPVADPAETHETLPATLPGTSGLPPRPASGNPTAAGPPGALTQNPAATPEATLKRAWDPQFLASLSQAVEGDSIQFELAGGEVAAGLIKHLERRNAQVLYVSGLLARPEAGRFFFQQQTLPGVAGDFVGVAEFPGSQRAWRIESTGPGGASELVERPLGSVICLGLPRPVPNPREEEIPPLKPDDSPVYPIPAYQGGIAVLESRPGSPAVIYLDFQGGYTPAWNGVVYDRPDLNNAQIRDVWARVAEDFMPFTINVTTDLKVYQSAVENCRQHVIITPTSTARPEAGGVSYEGSFNWTGDTPCWVFIIDDPKKCADACSHEVGHTLNLSHAGQDANGTNTAYFGGQGGGETSWAPIMGLPYYRPVTQWSHGEYAAANNVEDQLHILTSQNHVAYRPDDTGDTLATARYLEIYRDTTAGAEGVIETTGDVDAFQFTTAGGAVFLRADPVSASPNLALEVALYDAQDQFVLSSDPPSTLWAAIATNLPAGTFTFRVTGAARNDPRTNGFSNYGSLGYYSITGIVARARLPDRFTLEEHAPLGTTVGVVAATKPHLDPLRYAIVSGNSNGTFAIDSTGTLSVADNALLDYETLARQTQLPVQFDLFVDIVDPLDPAGTESHRRVVVAITHVNKPPTIDDFTSPTDNSIGYVIGPPARFTTSIVEHLPRGSLVCRVFASDPDPRTVLLYAIVAGNDNGMFRIDEGTGAIFVMGDTAAAAQNVYALTVVVSDQTPPSPLTVECAVTVRVQLPYARGGISYAVYTNIPGTWVSDLTGAASFPSDPGLVGQTALFGLGPRPETNCGVAMRGYLLPPATGNYTFWIASQDNGELWLNSSTNPAGMTLIAEIRGEGLGTGVREWTKYPSQQSAPISLAAGYAYYVEARMKAGAESNHLAVAWECAGEGMAQQVVPGDCLAPYVINYAPHPVGFAALLRRNAIAGAEVGTVAVVDLNTTNTSTLVIASGNEEKIFSIDPATGDIRLASEAALSASGRTHFTLEVRATDNGSPPLSGTGNVTIDVVPADAITTANLQEEIWTDIGGGAAVAELTNQSRFPNRPDALRALTDFDAGDQNFGTHCGSRIRAYLTPTNTGAYTFFIASSGGSQLNLSATTNPAGASVVASVPIGAGTGYQEWDRYASQRSGPVWLVAGQTYYVEARHKVASGPDHVAVGWTGPGLLATNPIAGAFLSPVDLGYPPLLRDQTARCPIMSTNGSLVTVVTASDSALDTLVYKIVSGNVSNTFRLDPASGRLTVADRTLLASGTAANFQLKVQAQDSGYGGLYPLRSAEATVTIAIVDNSPPIVWSGDGSDANWSTASNWVSTIPVNGRKLIFTGTNRQTNRNDLLTAAGWVKMGQSGFCLEGNPIELRGPLFSSGNNTWAIDTVFNDSQTISNGAGTLVVAGSVKNYGQTLNLLVNEEIRFDGVLSGTGGVAVTGSGRLVMSASNTYTGPTMIYSGALVLTNAGTISRSSTISLINLGGWGMDFTPVNTSGGGGGGGIWIFGGNGGWFNPFGGGLDLSAGAVLDVSGTPAVFTVPTGQILAGQGSVRGDAVIQGTLAPQLWVVSPTSIVTNQTLVTTYPFCMTFGNNLVLAGNTEMSLGHSSATFSGSASGAYTNQIFVFGNKVIPVALPSKLPWMGGISVMGELVCGGILTVTANLGFAPSAGDILQLFDAPRLSGSFASLSLPALPGGLEWDTSRLMVDGSIQVTRAAPQIAPVTSPGGLYAVRFPTAAGMDYVLESTLSLQPPAQWTPQATNAGTGGFVTRTLSVDRAQPQLYFRIGALPQSH